MRFGVRKRGRRAQGLNQESCLGKEAFAIRRGFFKGFLFRVLQRLLYGMLLGLRPSKLELGFGGPV